MKNIFNNDTITNTTNGIEKADNIYTENTDINPAN